MIQLWFLDPPSQYLEYPQFNFYDEKKNGFRDAEIWIREYYQYNYSAVKDEIKKIDYIDNNCYLAIVDARYKSYLIFCEKEFDSSFFRKLILNYLEDCFEVGKFIEKPLILKYPLVFRDAYSKGCWFSVSVDRFFGNIKCNCDFSNQLKNIKEFLV